MLANKHGGIGDGSQIASVRLLALNLKTKNGTPMVRLKPHYALYNLKVRPIKHGYPLKEQLPHTSKTSNSLKVRPIKHRRDGKAVRWVNKGVIWFCH